MPKYFHIAVNCGQKNPPIAAINSVVNSAKDWVRYAHNCWIIWTDLAPDAWYARIKPLLSADDLVLIIELNIQNRYGWVQQMVVDWFNRDRSPGRPGE